MLEPLSPECFTREAAAHLLNRAGFGGTPADVERLFVLGLRGAVDSLVAYERVPEAVPDPAWSVPDPAEVARVRGAKLLPDEQKRPLLQEIRKTHQRRSLELHQWWLERMRTTARPLQEKMTLFWHSLFATSIVKMPLRNPLPMWRQNQTFRSLATGNWPELLVAMGRDPAMLFWLDGVTNRAAHPNENFAREVMELFTLGEGNYTEQDVKEAARAFTGWAADPLTAEFTPRRPIQHDGGPKVILGQSGNFTGEDVLRLLGRQPRSAHYVSERLWRYFGSEEPNPALAGALADRFQQGGLEFKPLLSTLFLSQEFYAPEVMRRQVKGPVQWLVGACRALERPLPPPALTFQMMRMLGQVVFAPPSVKGWDTGVSWISTNTLLDRYNFSAFLVQGEPLGLPNAGKARQAAREMAKPGAMPAAAPLAAAPPVHFAPVDAERLFTPEERADDGRLLAALERRMIEASLGEARRQSLRQYLQAEKENPDRVRGALRLLMSTPDYQLT